MPRSLTFFTNNDDCHHNFTPPTTYASPNSFTIELQRSMRFESDLYTEIRLTGELPA